MLNTKLIVSLAESEQTEPNTSPAESAHPTQTHTQAELNNISVEPAHTPAPKTPPKEIPTNTQTKLNTSPAEHPHQTPATTQAELNNSPAEPAQTPVPPRKPTQEISTTTHRTLPQTKLNTHSTPTKQNQAKLNNFRETRNGHPSGRFAWQNNQINPETPKRKRSPDKPTQETPKPPKTPRLNQETTQVTQKPIPKPNLRKKPNPHPHHNQKQFTRTGPTLELLIHRGLAKTTRTKPRKPKPNQDYKPNLPTPEKPNQETLPITHRNPSKSFAALAKMFQPHTPPRRLLIKPNQDRNQTLPKNQTLIENQKPVNLKPAQKVDTNTCRNQQTSEGKPVTQKQNFQNVRNPPPRTEIVRDPSPPSPKNHLTQESSATPHPPHATTSHPTLPRLDHHHHCSVRNFEGTKLTNDSKSRTFPGPTDAAIGEQ